VSAARALRLVLATYNVHRCVGLDGRRDPERVLAVLDELDADVVALQELEWHPEDALHVLDRFARRLGCRGLAGPTLLARKGHYGNALLTRLAVREQRLIDLSVPGREPRGAIDVTLDGPAAPVRVLATHLGLRGRERRLQIARLLAPPDSPEPGAETAAVLLGDINDWCPWGRCRRTLRARFGRLRAPATYPARWPLLALDRICATPGGALREVAAHRSPLAREASDHLPLRAVLEL